MGMLKNTFNTMIGRNGATAAISAVSTVMAEVDVCLFTYNAVTSASPITMGVCTMLAGMFAGVAVGSATLSQYAVNLTKAERAASKNSAPQL